MEDYALGVSIVVAIVVIGTFISNLYSNKKSRDATYAASIMDIINELNKQNDEAFAAEDFSKLSVAVQKNANYCDILANLIIEEKFDSKFEEIVKPFLKDAHQTLVWFYGKDDVNVPRKYSDTYPYLNKWFKEEYKKDQKDIPFIQLAIKLIEKEKRETP